MLFDIRGRRKRFIQAIYLFLALLLGGGLVIFGIGGDAQGGLGSIFGLDSGGGSLHSSNPQFDDQIEEAEEVLEEDPTNEEALLTLVSIQFSAGQLALNEAIADNPNLTELPDDAKARYQASVDAWERFLDTKPKEPDTSALTALRSYDALFAPGVDADQLLSNTEEAVRTAEILVEADPGINAWQQLAVQAYRAGDTKTAEKAADEALKLADEKSDRTALQQRFRQAEQNGKQLKRILAAEAATQDELTDPLGSLGETAPGIGDATGLGAPATP